MSASTQPEIKFSPFEALLIGEKNRVIKRQPMKNTIFVTRLNQKRKTINLRALFGLEKNTANSKSNDNVFKIPQRVHEFLNNKKHNYENNKIAENKEKNVICNEYKGHKVFVKSNNSVKPKYKKSKVKSNKVKFKEKSNRDGNEKVVNKVLDTLRNPSTINLTKRNIGMPKVVLKDIRKDLCSASRYQLRGKDRNFTYANLKLNGVNSKIKPECLSNYVQKFLTDNNKNIYDNDNKIKNENFKKFQVPNKENLGGMTKWHKEFDLSSPDILLNDLLKHNYHCHGEFKFPKCPETGISDFDNDDNLFDIIYESFPKSFKFDSKDSSHDYIDSLIKADIIKPIKNSEINIMKKMEADQRVKINFGTQTSSMNLPRSIDLSSCYHLETLKNGYIASADGFVAIQNHLITDENFGSLFLNNPDDHNKNDLIMASLMKPLIHNSWVRSLQNF